MQQAEPTRAKSLSWIPLSAVSMDNETSMMSCRTNFPKAPAAESAQRAQAVAFLMINAFQDCGKLQQCLCDLNIPIL
jgi:hypothetical protein